MYPINTIAFNSRESEETREGEGGAPPEAFVHTHKYSLRDTLFVSRRPHEGAHVAGARACVHGLLREPRALVAQGPPRVHGQLREDLYPLEARGEVGAGVLQGRPSGLSDVPALLDADQMGRDGATREGPRGLPGDPACSPRMQSPGHKRSEGAVIGVGTYFPAARARFALWSALVATLVAAAIILATANYCKQPSLRERTTAHPARVLSPERVVRTDTV